MHESDLDKLSGMRLQLEVQVNTLESANINANTLDVMRRGANALRDIHNGLCVTLIPPPPHTHTLSLFVSCSFVFTLLTKRRICFWVLVFSNIDKVDATMNSINEQRDVANEISEAISNTANIGLDIDEVRKLWGRGRLLFDDRTFGLPESMVCRTISRQSWENSSRRISTNDSWAQIMYQCIPQRVRAVSRCHIKRPPSTRMRNSKHCKLHLPCRDGFSFDI